MLNGINIKMSLELFFSLGENNNNSDHLTKKFCVRDSIFCMIHCSITSDTSTLVSTEILWLLFVIQCHLIVLGRLSLHNE